MTWRVIATAVVWFAGLSLAMWRDGQAFHHASELLATTVIGCAPWIPLAFGRRGEQGRRAAIIVMLLSAIVIVLVAASLPSAYESQRRFNERALLRDT